MLALLVGREGLDAELRRQLREPVLGRADPLAADLDDLAVADLMVEHAPADAVTRLEHHAVDPLGGELPRGRQPGQPGSDHDDVGSVRIQPG